MVEKRKFAVIGFSKCGTMSLAEYLKKKYPKCEVTRPENIYEEPKEPHIIPKWREWECVSITRDPISRIHSGHQYFTVLRQSSIEDVLRGNFHNAKNYANVGFADPIRQSNYQFYINKFQRDHGVKVTNYRFEDLIKDPDFPHINETVPENRRKWTEREMKYVESVLVKAGIKY